MLVCDKQIKINNGIQLKSNVPNQTTTSTQKTIQRVSHAQRTELSEQRMFEATVALIVEQGTEKTTLKAVGESAGYSRGLAGSRFSSKQGLFCFVIKRVAEFWLNEMMQATENLSGFSAISAAIDAHYHFCKFAPHQVRAYYILWFESIGLETDMRDIVVAIHRRRLNDVIEWISSGQQAGTIAANIDAEAVARQFLSTVTGIIYQWLIDPSQDQLIKSLHDNLKQTMRFLLTSTTDFKEI
ncbi:MAG: AcrR family transcriptional regulator [Gammaproteobacteria bacterium]|jgi:AcrR family transcriptional regulator